MAREFKRSDRIAEQIQKELAWLIQREIKDPRLGMVTLHDVRVSRDMGYADIYYTLLSAEELSPDSEEVQESLKILRGAAGYLRTALAKAMKLRTIPYLRFHFDTLAGESRHLDALINKAVASNRNDDEDEGDGEH